MEVMEAQETNLMRLFQLNRREDPSGVSGTGIVAEGVEFHDGQVALSFFGQHHAVEILPNIRTVAAIHGHGGKTTIVWVRSQPPQPKGLDR